ncbi:MAG: hypothetical protein AB7F43_09780 [Bacteriovoracia bacterium]
MNVMFTKRISVVLIFTLVTAIGCVAAKNAQDEGSFTRKLSFNVNSYFKSDIKNKTFYVVREGEYDSLDFDRDINWVKKALTLESLKEADSKEHADIVIYPTFVTEKPATGISLGLLFPFTHRLSLLAKKKGQTIWKISVDGPSEYAERNSFTAVLLGAARHHFGKDTVGSIQYTMSENDPKVEEILK